MKNVVRFFSRVHPSPRAKPVTANEEGSVIIIVSFALLVLVLSVGAAIDMSRLQTAKAKFNTCLDNAGLAGLSKVNNPPVGVSAQDWVTQVANKYYVANCQSGFGNTSTITLTNANVQLSADTNTVTLDATTTQTTKFMSIVGVNNLTLTAHSVVTRADGNGLEVSLVLDNTGSMAMTPDSKAAATYSNTRIYALQQAATSLVNILIGATENTAPPNMWIGIVPFAQSVNIGNTNTSWLDNNASGTDFGPVSATNTTCLSYNGKSSSTNGRTSGFCTYNLSSGKTPNFGLTNWYGCVEARIGNDTTDAAPSTQPFPAYWAPSTTITDNNPTPPTIYLQSAYANYPQLINNSQYLSVLANPWFILSGNTTTTYEDPLQQAVYPSTTTYPQGPNSYCTTPITQMTNDKVTLLTAINNMVPNGQTIIPVGMSWGWYMLSQNWQGAWGANMTSNGLPKNYNTKGNIKALVFMTDGYNYFFPGSYTSYATLLDGELVGTNPKAANFGKQIFDETGAEAELDYRTQTICTNMKNDNIIIYTVGFGQTDNINVMAPSGTPDVNGPQLQSCATDSSKYFFATSAAAINQDFEEIAASLSNLRVSQ